MKAEISNTFQPSSGGKKTGARLGVTYEQLEEALEERVGGERRVQENCGEVTTEDRRKLQRRQADQA